MAENILVKVATKDEICLDGYYCPNSNAKSVLIFIHGFTGNFYQDTYIPVLAKELKEHGIAFLSGNTRGAGKDTTFVTTSGEKRYIGGQYELLEEAHYDISAWIQFLVNEGYDDIILCGHSLGAIKCARYPFDGELVKNVKKIILLNPFDRSSLITKSKRSPYMIKTIFRMAKNSKSRKLVDVGFEGVKISLGTLSSWFKNNDINRMLELSNPEYDFNVLRKIEIPVCIIVGSEDQYLKLIYEKDVGVPLKTMTDNIKKSVGKVIVGAGHSLVGYEKELSKNIVEFIIEGK